MHILDTSNRFGIKYIFPKLLLTVVACSASLANAAPSLYAGQQLISPAATALFNDAHAGYFQYGHSYQEAGLNFTFDGAIATYTSMVPVGGDGSRVLYTGGSQYILKISATSGAAFDAFQMQVGSGWGSRSQYRMSALNNSAVVGDYYWSSPTAGFVGLQGGEFDEVWIVAYPNGWTQDQGLVDLTHLPNAVMLDFVSYTYSNTAPVPEPETYAMMLAGLGLLGVAARRRKQKSEA